MPTATVSDLLGDGYIAHYSTYDLADLWQDTAGTTPVVAGSVIRRFDSVGGSLTSPLLAVSGTAEMTGSGDNRAIFTSVATAAFQVTLASAPARLGVIAVLSNLALQTGTIWTLGGNTGQTYTRGNQTASSTLQLSSSVGGATALTASSGGTSGTAEAYCWVAGTTESRLTSCIDADGNKTTNLTSATLVTVGALRNNSAQSQYGQFYLYELLLADLDGLSHTKLLEVASLLRDKWSLADPDPLPQISAASGGMAGINGGLVLC
jgi:hypothetical protein